MNQIITICLVAGCLVAAASAFEVGQPLSLEKIGEGDDNLPIGGGEKPPIGGGDDNKPPIGGGDDQPPIGGGDDKPPIGGGDENVPIGEDDNVPYEGRNKKSVGVQQTNYCLQEHNQARQQNGRQPLAADGRLEAAAEKHNQVMVSQNCFSHRCNGEPSLGDRVSQQGYNWRGVGENIAKGQRDCADAMRSWMNSDGHRRNILGDYKHVGCHMNPNGNHFTCVFGNPM